MEGSTGVRFLWHLKAAQVRLFPLGFISSPTSEHPHSLSSCRIHRSTQTSVAFRRELPIKPLGPRFHRAPGAPHTERSGLSSKSSGGGIPGRAYWKESAHREFQESRAQHTLRDRVFEAMTVKAPHHLPESCSLGAQAACIVLQGQAGGVLLRVELILIVLPKGSHRTMSAVYGHAATAKELR
jgi:hypothetical protein